MRILVIHGNRMNVSILQKALSPGQYAGPQDEKIFQELDSAVERSQMRREYAYRITLAFYLVPLREHIEARDADSFPRTHGLPWSVWHLYLHACL